MTRGTLLFFGLLFCLLSAASAWAEHDTVDMAGKRERVHSLILMRLTERLGLNSTQSQQIGQMMRKYHERRAGLKHQMRELTAQLRAATASSNDAQIQTLLNQTSQARAGLDQLNAQMFAEIRPLLNPKQQAQFLIVMDEIRGEVRAIRRQGGPYGPGFPGSNNPNYFPGVNPGVNSPDGVRVGP